MLIGVDDSGIVRGLPDPDQTLLQTVSLVRDSIKPDVSMFVRCDVEIRDSKPIVKVIVQRGIDLPYYIAEKGLRPSGVYVRMGSASVPATDSAIFFAELFG